MGTELNTDINEMRKVIIACFSYEYGYFSIGGIQAARIIGILGGQYGTDTLLDSLSKASYEQTEEAFNELSNIRSYMLKHPIKRCPCCKRSTDLKTFPKNITNLLQQKGCIFNADAFERFVENDEFWEKHPYNNRLYFGKNNFDYIHRDILRVVVKVLKSLTQEVK